MSGRKIGVFLFSFFLQTLGKFKQDMVVGGEEVLREVLAQLAILALFTPAHKTWWVCFPVSSP